MALKNIRPDTASDKRERGPWHPSTKAQKPVHVGWYEVRSNLVEDEIFPRYWNGIQWCMISVSGIVYEVLVQNRKWRGLAEKPE